MMKIVKVLAFGGIEQLSIAQAPLPKPTQDEVMIKVSATDINRADILQRKGLYPPPKGTTDILGLECAGVICQGNQRWKEGTRVLGFLRGGGYAEYAVVNSGQVLPVPEGLDLVQAAAVAEVWLTAYKCLKHISRCAKGETVLVHAGASGVGSALIQLGKYYGLQVFATCGSDEKVEYCKKLGADLAINYKTSNWAEEVKLNGGADLIMDSVGRGYWDDNVSVLRQQGRWVIYGFLSGSKLETDLMRVFAKQASVYFTSFRGRSDEYRNSVVAEFVNEGLMNRFVGDGDNKFDACVYKVIDIEDVALGHKIIESNENLGKIVMRV